MTRTRTLVAAGLAALVLTAVAAASSKSTNLSLIAYSTPKPVMAKIIQAWQQTPDGSGVTFSQSYGPSTNQAKAVAAGQPADLVFLSTGDDVNLLVDAGLVNANWSKQSYNGIAADTVVVFAVRQGNPKHIKSWADLIKPGVQVLTPNPFTSGSARWNVMAAYGAQIKEGKTPAQAEEYLKALFHNVVSQDSSARNALQTFLAGRGDALIDYENEAISDQKKGAAIEYVIPDDTILIQNPVAVVGSSESAKKFVEYLTSPAGQAIWVEKGYRPVISGVPGASKFPTPSGLFTIEDLGGWKKITKEFFEPETGIVTKIEQSLGVSTSK
jgi:sulfate/thiosulfate transport system substrate-binding protein